MKIVHELDQKLLNKKTYLITLDHEGEKTPSKESLKSKVADFLKVNQDLIKINNIFTEFGKSSSKLNVDVFNSLQDLKLLEVKKKQKKNGEKEKSKK